MEAQEIPYCCALQVIYDLASLGLDDEFSREEAKRLNDYLDGTLKAEGTCNGQYITSSVAFISPAEGTAKEFKDQQDALRKAGMKLICKFPGHHVKAYGRPYMIEMWGTKNMEVAGAIRRSRSVSRVSQKTKRSFARRHQ